MKKHFFDKNIIALSFFNFLHFFFSDYINYNIYINNIKGLLSDRYFIGLSNKLKRLREKYGQD
jgi:hypothetical protein